MATKAKSPTPSAPATTLEGRLAEALKDLEAGVPEAKDLLVGLEEEAVKAENVSLARTCRNYLTMLARRAQGTSAKEESNPELEAMVALNSRDFPAALALAEKGLVILPQRAQLHYIKALALVKTGKPEAGAEALRTSVSLQRDLVYQYQLEPDFNSVRHHASFVEFELA